MESLLISSHIELQYPAHFQVSTAPLPLGSHWAQLCLPEESRGDRGFWWQSFLAEQELGYKDGSPQGCQVWWWPPREAGKPHPHPVGQGRGCWYLWRGFHWDLVPAVPQKTLGMEYLVAIVGSCRFLFHFAFYKMLLILFELFYFSSVLTEGFYFFSKWIIWPARLFSKFKSTM